MLPPNELFIEVSPVLLAVFTVETAPEANK